MDEGAVSHDTSGREHGRRGWADWFVRRAGLARFATFACALGLMLSAFIGPQSGLAVGGLTVAIAASLGGVIWNHRRQQQRLSSREGGGTCDAREVPDDSRTATHRPHGVAHSGYRLGSGGARGRDSSIAAWLLVIPVLLIGLFGGYLAGSLRVAALTDGCLQSRVGESVRAELCIVGQVRSNSGWQSATAMVTSLARIDAEAGDMKAPGNGADGAVAVSATAPLGERATDGNDPGVGERVLLEVAPPERSLPSIWGDAATGSNGSDTSIPFATLSQGMIVTFEGQIEEPDGPSDSGYDQSRQLLHQGIEVVFHADGPDRIVILGRRGGVSGWFDRLRESARAHLSLGPSDSINEVLQGVIMGDTAGIHEGWMTDFRRSGTAHMFSVSGLHVASLAGIVIGLARLAGAARWVGFVLAMIAALLMIPFVGSSPPIVRAAVMICVVLTGRWVGRGRDQWQILGLAAVVVLALNPYGVFDVGFQLSFAAFVGMLTLIRPLERVLVRLPEAVRANMAVSMAASAGTAPVSLAVFSQASLVSPLANLLVVSTLPAITGLGLASVFLGFVWSGLSVALDTLASLPMVWTVQVSRLMAVAPVLTAADLGTVMAALFTASLVLPVALAVMGRATPVPLGAPLPAFKRSLGWVRAHRPRNRRLGVSLGIAIMAAGLLAGALLQPAVTRGWGSLEAFVTGRGWPDRVEVRVLDIGQGNAVLVRTPEHRALLFDGGPAGCGLAGQLRGLGVRKLDLVVISHPHADHFAGLLEALDDVEVKALIDQMEVVQAADVATAGVLPEQEHGEAADYLKFRRELAEKDCRYAFAETGYSVTVDGIGVRFYAPARPLVLTDGGDPWAQRGEEPSGDDLNGSSLVALLSVGEIDVLLPGDAEAETLQRYGLPTAEVLIVPHHGSKGAVSERLLAGLQAQVAVVSVGEGNTFGHPHAGTLSALEKDIGVVLRTDTVGWVSCTIDEDTMVITTERTPILEGNRSGE